MKSQRLVLRKAECLRTATSLSPVMVAVPSYRVLAECFGIHAHRKTGSAGIHIFRFFTCAIRLHVVSKIVVLVPHPPLPLPRRQVNALHARAIAECIWLSLPGKPDADASGVHAPSQVPCGEARSEAGLNFPVCVNLQGICEEGSPNTSPCRWHGPSISCSTMPVATAGGFIRAISTVSPTARRHPFVAMQPVLSVSTSATPILVCPCAKAPVPMARRTTADRPSSLRYQARGAERRLTKLHFLQCPLVSPVVRVSPGVARSMSQERPVRTLGQQALPR